MTILTDENIEWHEYQKKLLARIPKYKENQSIHLVAPPGSGKTYLGIEIVRQLNRKTLILVPSLVLKQQWTDTIQTAFLKNKSDRIQISTSIESIKEITIETYQTVYSRLADDIGFLERKKIDVLVLDEAHHLKKSWGEFLLKLKASVPQLLTVSLTATPPYDANVQEWQQYQLLNGPIDEEITIPELIKEQVLAPHQDYLYLVSAPSEITNCYENFLQKQANVVEAIVASVEIADYLLAQAFIQDPKNQAAFIYQSFEVYLSALLFLQLHGYQLTDEHWLLLGLTKAQGEKISFPTFEKQHMSDLLVYLYEKAPNLLIFNYLETQGWVAQNQLQLFPDFSENILNQAPIEKKTAISQILLCEYEKLGRELSGLVLTDFIKKEVLLGKNGELEYGLIPIFDSLMPFFKEEIAMGVICGEFLIIPKTLQEHFLPISIKIDEHPYFSGYAIVYPNEKKQSEALTILTQLVNEKTIQLLIGTSSLLGEGWNCPAINTVVLANHSASFVQTQQLRGRGLRINEEGKTTNIWHLAVVIPRVDYSKQVNVNRIIQRMSYVCGLTFETDPSIESGIERFDLLSVYSGKEIAVYNQEMLYWSGQRSQLAAFWQQALKKGSHLTMPLIVRKESRLGPIEGWNFVVKAEVAPNSIKRKRNPWIVASIFTTASLVVAYFNLTLGSMLLGLDGAALLFTLNQKKVSKAYSKYNRKKAWQKEIKHVRQLAFSITETMIKLNMVASDALDRLSMAVSEKECSCYLAQASYQEERLFYTAMAEALSEIKNPRYFIYTQKAGFFSVPEVFAKNKKSALLYQKAIEHYFSVRGDLIYSRTLNGRKQFVQAKISEVKLSKEASQNKIIQKSIWQ